MKKVKNNSGATILMALLLILLSTAVGAAVLTAAVSAARHLRSDREAQQNYLTVSSAAELIRDSIAGDKYTRTMTETYTEPKDDDGNITYTVTYSTDVKSPTGIMKEWLSACIEDGGEKDRYASFKAFSDTINVDLEVGKGTSLRTVQAKFSAEPSTITMEGKVLYISIIQVELSLAPENGKADDCRMTLTMQGKLEMKGDPVPPEPNKESYPFTTTVKWGSPIIKKGIGTKEAGT